MIIDDVYKIKRNKSSEQLRKKEFSFSLIFQLYTADEYGDEATIEFMY